MSQVSPIYSLNHYLPGKELVTWNRNPLRRDKGTWEQHLSSIKSYCKSQAVIYDNTNTTGGTLQHKANDCNSWDCPQCRKKKASTLRSRIKAGSSKQTWRLLTLTFDPKKVSLHDCLSTCSHTWDLFQKRLKRVFPDIAWIKVIEFQQNGYPHFHIILNKYIHHSWIKQTWISLSGGEVFRIEKVKNDSVSRYVAGYLSHKDHKHHELDYQFFYYSLRRFAFSRNYHLRPWLKTTVVFTRGIDFDCSGEMFRDVVKIFYSKGVFFAVTKQNGIKYINLFADKYKLKMC